jgi:hypothetical protein
MSLLELPGSSVCLPAELSQLGCVWGWNGAHEYFFSDPDRVGSFRIPLRILWFLPEDVRLETKPSNEGKPESEQARPDSERRVGEDSGFPLVLAG